MYGIISTDSVHQSFSFIEDQCKVLNCHLLLSAKAAAGNEHKKQSTKNKNNFNYVRKNIL